MSLGDIAIAMQGINKGAEDERTKRRVMAERDLAMKQRTAEYDRYNQMTPLEIEKATNSNRISGSQANTLEGTEESKINTVNAQADDLLSGLEQRMADGTPQKEAMAQLSDAERKIVEDRLSEDRAQALTDAGAADSEATASVSGSEAETSAAKRSKNADDNAVKTRVDEIDQWAQRSEDILAAEQATDDANDIKTDRLNGISMYEAVTRKNLAKAEDSNARLVKRLAEQRLESGFDMNKFLSENMEEVSGNALQAVGLARVGGDAGRRALPLINMDANNDGKLDYEGAVAAEVKTIDGEEYLVAVDEQGEIVASTAAPDVPGMKVAELRELALDAAKTKAAKTAKAAAPRKPTPVKISDVEDLDDLGNTLLGNSFGARMVDLDKDGKADEFNTLGDAVPADYVDAGDEIMNKVLNDTSALMARFQRDGESVAAARTSLSSPVDIARNVYGATNQDIINAELKATKRAQLKSVEKMRAAGELVPSDHSKVPVDPTVKKQELNKVLLQIMANAQPQI